MSPPLSLSVDRVILMGFMGSGKTTVGKLLADRLGWRFADLDSAVEQRCGESVPQIFATLGEQHFRNEEAAALRDLTEGTQVIVALGGGAIEHTGSQALLRSLKRTSLIYLQAPFSQLEARCLEQATLPDAISRPLLSDPAVAQNRFALREPIYKRLATLEVDTSTCSPEQVLSRILESLS